MDWCAILYILSIYITDIIQRTLFTYVTYVSKLRLNHPSSHLFHSITQTLNGFISKRRFGKIGSIPEHLKIYHSLNIYARDLRFGT